MNENTLLSETKFNIIVIYLNFWKCIRIQAAELLTDGWTPNYQQFEGCRRKLETVNFEVVPRQRSRIPGVWYQGSLHLQKTKLNTNLWYKQLLKLKETTTALIWNISEWMVYWLWHYSVLREKRLAMLKYISWFGLIIYKSLLIG